LDYSLLGPDMQPLEARTSVENGRIILHSRSGRPRSSSRESRGRNPDYVTAFDTIFDRINSPSPAIERVLLDSAPARASSETERTLASADDFDKASLSEVKTMMRAKMRAFGRSDGMPANEGNQNKKIRVDTSLSDDEIVRRLRAVPYEAFSGARISDGAVSKSVARLPFEELRKVGPEHIRAALARLDAGDAAENFDPLRDFDVKTGDGRAYAPKKVFGLALEEALGIVAKPGHFNAGWKTPCFDILEECGLWIVPKFGSGARPKPPPPELAEANLALSPTEEERTWIEGNPRIATHLKKERQPGLAAKKRAQFIKDHGKLQCERCGLDPSKIYGSEAGPACIEVHHHRTHVADMKPGHETSLDDLKCLCSNCHRVLHRSLALGAPFEL